MRHLIYQCYYVSDVAASAEIKGNRIEIIETVEPQNSDDPMVCSAVCSVVIIHKISGVPAGAYELTAGDHTVDADLSQSTESCPVVDQAINQGFCLNDCQAPPYPYYFYNLACLEGNYDFENCECVNENVVVDLVSELTPATIDPLPQFVTVRLRGGRDLTLDMSIPTASAWFDMLDLCRENNSPIYLEIDPITTSINDLLLPIVGKVLSINPTAEAVEVELYISAAIHFLKRSNPNFQQFLDILTTSQNDGTDVWVSTDYNIGNEIMDVRWPVIY